MELHSDELSGNFAIASWDHYSNSMATSLLHGLTDYDFILAFLIAYLFLSHSSGITIKLQRTTIDIIDAYQQIDETKAFFRGRLLLSFQSDTS